jgi:hypothetical protein
LVTLIPVRQSGHRQVRFNPFSETNHPAVGLIDTALPTFESDACAYYPPEVKLEFLAWIAPRKNLTNGCRHKLHQRDVVDFTIGIDFDLLAHSCESELGVIFR